ncbi:MAG: hypothetical protein MSC30_19285, partial [Gaiellaceae bacterium MAG52_C11]|nr:hypothetical protein [Candidatus Gaiellasilicea maunaloa]
LDQDATLSGRALCHVYDANDALACVRVGLGPGNAGLVGGERGHEPPRAERPLESGRRDADELLFGAAARVVDRDVLAIPNDELVAGERTLRGPGFGGYTRTGRAG